MSNRPIKKENNEFSAKFQKHREYVPIDAQWIDSIPSHWKEGLIKYIYDVQVGKMLQSKQQSPSDVKLPYLKARDIPQNGEFDINDLSEMWFSPDDRQQYNLQQGDVLVAEGGDVGRSAVWPGSDEEILYQNAINRIRPRESDSTRFLCYWINWLKENGYIKILCNNATILHYTAEKVDDTPLLIPPVNEQEKISEFLDYKIDGIESLIGRYRSLIDLLVEKLQVQIEDMILGQTKSGHSELTSDLSVIDSIPSEWKIRRGKTLFRQRDDRGYNDLPLLEVSLNHGVRLRDENNERNAWVSSDLGDMKRVEQGDLVFNKMRLWQGAIGCSNHTGLVSPDYIVLECLPETHPEYYSNLIQTEAYKAEVDRRSYGVVDDRKRIYWKKFGDLPLLHPPFSEQRMIVNSINNMTDEIEILQSKINSSIELLQEKRYALITQALTGQIDLSDWSRHS